MLTRPDKEIVVNQLKKDLGKAQAVFVTNLVGVTANNAVQIRRDVRKANGSVHITRNTLMRRAAEGTAYESILTGLKGPNAVAIAYNDAAAVAKVLFEAGKTIEVVTLKAGVLDGKVLKAPELVQLANLPSRDQMLGTLLATFNAPISAFVRVVKAIGDQKQEQNA